MVTKDDNLDHSKSVENFLKAVYVLQQQMDPVTDAPTERDLRVSTNALSDALAISPPSVTDMARRMTAAGLVDYRRYYGVRLTDKGESIALRVIRRHRLIELYLSEELDYDLYEVHDEAEELEHAVSDRFIEAIAAKLGNPTLDPHGDPIPAADGTIQEASGISLAKLQLNVEARVSRFASDKPDLLQHIMTRNFKLGSQVMVLRRDPFDGPLTARVDGVESTIGHNVAMYILVEVDGA